MRLTLIIVGALIVILFVVRTIIAVMSRKFEKDWKSMSSEQRFKLQNDMRKEEI